jgi:hypothetical protein
VSAVLLGGNVSVRKGSDRGGVFRHVPTCRHETQLACVVAFSTFNETPPDASFFGRGASRVAAFSACSRGPELEHAWKNPPRWAATAPCRCARSSRRSRSRPGR